MWQYPNIPLELTETAVAADIMVPYNRVKTPLADYARGGVALLDASRGLNVKNWVCEVQNGGVFLSADNVQPFRIETIRGEPTWISFAFDQNMHYNLAYKLEDGEAYHYWYDVDSRQYITMALGKVNTPFLRLDDVRIYPSFHNDILLSYIKERTLYARLQRDRYAVEYKLAEDVGQRISRCGMNMRLRFQWECA